MKTSICSIAIAGVMSGLIGTVQAGVIDPTQPVEGQSQLALSEQWWQWALGIPAASNPLADADGSLANINNTGSVFFLAGSLGGTVSRTIEVPAGKPLFFPVLNTIYIFTPETSEACAGVADPVACALPYIDMSGATNLQATLNGQNLLTHSSYRQTSTVLSTLNLPAGSFWDGVLNTGDHAFVTDGYWVALEPLARGTYTLEFGGEIGGARSRWWTSSASRSRALCCSRCLHWPRWRPGGEGHPTGLVSEAGRTRRMSFAEPSALATQPGPFRPQRKPEGGPTAA